MSKKKIIYIVTGCAGFIGFHVCKILLEKNYKVLGIDNINNYYDKDLKINRLRILKKNKVNFKFYKIDICNFKKMERIIKLSGFNSIIFYIFFSISSINISDFAHKLLFYICVFE